MGIIDIGKEPVGSQGRASGSVRRIMLSNEAGFPYCL